MSSFDISTGLPMKIVYFQAVAVSCPNPDYPLTNLALGLERGWLPPPGAPGHVTLVFALKHRARLNAAIISALPGQPLQGVQFQISDSMGGQTLQPFKSMGACGQVGTGFRQVMLTGIGKFVRLQLSGGGGIRSVSFFGEGLTYGVKSTGGDSRNSEKTDQIMLELGIRPRLQWAEGLEHMPISTDSKQTYMDLQRKARQATERGDFQYLARLEQDQKQVFNVGKKMLDLEIQIKLALAKDDYQTPARLNQQYLFLLKQLDRIDAIHETSRYFRGIELGDDSQMFQRILAQDMENERKRAELQQQLLSELQRNQQQMEAEAKKLQRQAKPWFKTKLDEDQPIQRIAQPKEQREDPVPRRQQQFKNQFIEDQPSEKPEPEQQEEPQQDQLQGYLSPQLLGLRIEPGDQSLQKFRDLNYIESLGERVWYGIVSVNWKYREAAAKSVLKYAEAGLPAKYAGKSRSFFEAVVQFARNCCLDKVISIYFMGLSIFQTALAPPICGPDVPPQVVNAAIKQFTQILVTKVEELNSSASDKSLPVLLSIYKHPAADIKHLVSEALKVCANSAGDSSFKPISKQPPRVPMSRMKILLTGYYKLPQLAAHAKEIASVLLAPCLTHPSAQVRTRATDGLLLLSQAIPRLFQESLEQYKKQLRPATLESVEQRRGKFSKEGLLKSLQED